MVLSLARLLGGFALARFLTRNGFVVMGWHGVSIEDEHTRFPQYFISPSTLSRRLEFIKKHFAIISLEEAMKQHASGEIKPRQAVLTFDDGLYDFTAAGVPVLKEHDATGTLYVVSSKIGNCLASTMAARDIILRAQQAQGQDGVVVAAGERDNLASHQENLLAINEDERAEYLRKMAVEYDVDMDPVLEKRIWNHHQPDELKQLVREGFGVQVHTHNHTTTIEAPERVFEEANTCREFIEKTVDAPAIDYCYPSGLWQHAAWEPLKKAGMRGAVTCKTGPNFASTPALALRRYVDHEQSTQLEFEALVSGWNWLTKVIFNPRRYSEPSVALAEGPPYI